MSVTRVLLLVQESALGLMFFHCLVHAARDVGAFWRLRPPAVHQAWLKGLWLVAITIVFAVWVPICGGPVVYYGLELFTPTHGVSQ